jgi:hypothetical protein
METWKEIEGFTSRYGKPYWVSDQGNFRNPYGRMLCFHSHPKGYQTVQIPKKDSSSYRAQTHRLVALAFVPNPNNYPQVNHMNGIKTDNRAVNLEWCTNSQNMAHAIANGLRPDYKAIYSAKEKKGRHKVSNQTIIEIRAATINKNGRGGLRRRDLAKKYNVPESFVKDVRNGRVYTYIK